jgi:hypothetical protein
LTSKVFALMAGCSTGEGPRLELSLPKVFAFGISEVWEYVFFGEFSEP